MTGPADNPPTLYEWIGGMAALDRLANHFYERVRRDEILESVFAQMPGDHPHHVAQFIAEVFGGPASYSESRGGHPHMISRHLGRHLTQVQRRRWLELLLQSADAVGFPDDPEFRSALVAYLEWGSRAGGDQLTAGGSVVKTRRCRSGIGACRAARIAPNSRASSNPPFG